MGAIALPLALLFGVEALEYRLKTAGASAVITNAFGMTRIAKIRDRLPELKTVISIDGGEALYFADLVAAYSPVFEAAGTGPD
ncbi:hypothetical protein, partial [Chryseobacterium sp. SIMBA_028]|uniref:hypothetical protein n=1 Tax=Chryseobacterium sp. SIMBA_028 TaxID=3085771 RepID=UPI00397E4EFA